MFEQIAQSRLALALLAALLAAVSAAFFMGRRTIVALAGADPRGPHTWPKYHGYLVALRTLAHALAERRGEFKLYATIISGLLGIAGFALVLAHVRRDRRARNPAESAIKLRLVLCSGVAILTTMGIMTGVIVGLARALRETAPLFLNGILAFVADVPDGPMDSATALPVLIYKWSISAERAWQPMNSAAIIILLVFMFGMNALAVYLRRRLERRW